MSMLTTGVGSADGGFDPLSLSPALWLKSDAGLSQDSAGTTPATADGDPVGKWADQSGAGRHVSQGTAGFRPTLKLAIQNGRNVVRFDGVDDYLAFTASAFAALTAGEMFITVKIAADPPAGGQTGLWILGSGAAGHYPFTDGTIYDTAGSTARKTTVNPTPSLAAWHVYGVTSDSGLWTNRLDGSQLFTTATNTVGWGVGPMLGRDASQLNGDIGEMLIYGSALSNADRQAVEAYLKTRWATP